MLKTSGSALWRSHPDEFVDTFVGVSLAAAEWIVARGIRLVGIDYLSVGPFHTTGTETHLALLGNDVIVVEGLDLHEIEPGHYELLCFPLKIRSGDGAPARVALRGPLRVSGGVSASRSAAAAIVSGRLAKQKRASGGAVAGSA